MNTKADLRFNVAKADFLPAWIKERLIEQAGHACHHKLGACRTCMEQDSAANLS